MESLNWDALDVVLVTGDAYIDSPHIGVAVVGKALLRSGFRVGVIAQPDTRSPGDILRLGEPSLFWGVTGGSIDSMVANYTPLRKKRKSDDYTPGGINNRRPDRAVIVYANLIRRFNAAKKPIVLGGLEASLRRIAHYDFWSDSIRRSIIFDAKADVLVYGMGEYSAVELAKRISTGRDYRDMRGICYIAKDKTPGYAELPSFEEVSSDIPSFIEMFQTFSLNNDPVSGKGLYQKHGDRYLVHNPPWPVLTEQELDSVYDMDFERELHPFYRQQGEVKALDTIRFSITTHRGCFGRCNFCSISAHEGSIVVSRSERSILAETRALVRYPRFKGNIQDVGGPTANMYGIECRKTGKGSCSNRRCLYPDICPHLKVDHARQIGLLRKLRSIDGIRKVFIASGIRHDLVCADTRNGQAFIKELCEHHVSGQMKVAPEHVVERVLDAMAKSGTSSLLRFRNEFSTITRQKNKRQYLTYYFIAAHPGCTEEDMMELKSFIRRHLKITPEQVQIFTPTPSTYSTLMYYTGLDPFTGRKIFVEKDPLKKKKQKDIITGRGDRE
jgi:uncharacterized radical SAM protein YgiQ